MDAVPFDFDYIALSICPLWPDTIVMASARAACSRIIDDASEQVAEHVVLASSAVFFDDMSGQGQWTAAQSRAFSSGSDLGSSPQFETRNG
jgi:hypothetical protein